MTTYRRRVIDDLLDELQPSLRAVSIHGPKGVGKTATAARRAKTIVDLDLPRTREIIDTDPSVLTAMRGPVLVDEWQRMPQVWDDAPTQPWARQAPSRGPRIGHHL